MKGKLIARVIPFLILGIILVRTWYIIMTTEYYATSRHIIALIFFLGNLILYFFRFQYAILLTGIILILATFNLLVFFPDIAATSYFIKFGSREIGTPGIQWKILLLLIVYLIVNFDFFIELYLDFKDKKKT